MVCILFDENSKPIGISKTPWGSLPTSSTLKRRRATFARHWRNCTSKEQDDSLMSQMILKKKSIELWERTNQ